MRKRLRRNIGYYEMTARSLPYRIKRTALYLQQASLSKYTQFVDGAVQSFKLNALMTFRFQGYQEGQNDSLK